MGPNERELQHIRNFVEKHREKLTPEQQLTFFYVSYRSAVNDLQSGRIRVQFQDDPSILPKSEIAERIQTLRRGFFRAVQSIPPFASMTGILFDDGEILRDTGLSDPFMNDDDNLVSAQGLTEFKQNSGYDVSEYSRHDEDFAFSFWQQACLAFS